MREIADNYAQYLPSSWQFENWAEYDNYAELTYYCKKAGYSLNIQVYLTGDENPSYYAYFYIYVGE